MTTLCLLTCLWHTRCAPRFCGDRNHTSGVLNSLLPLFLNHAIPPLLFVLCCNVWDKSDSPIPFVSLFPFSLLVYPVSLSVT